MSYVKSIRKGTNGLITLKEVNNTLTDDSSIAKSMHMIRISPQCLHLGHSQLEFSSELSTIVCKETEISHILKNLNVFKVPWAGPPTTAYFEGMRR